MILIFFFFSVKILYWTKFSFRLKVARMAGMTRNMPKFSFFFFTAGVSEASEPRQSRVGAVSAPRRRVSEKQKKKKKKEDTRRTPESGE